MLRDCCGPLIVKFLHCLKNCKPSSLTWDLTFLGLSTNSSRVVEFGIWARVAKASLDLDALSRFFTIPWCIWNCRNDDVHDRTQRGPEEIA